MKYNARFVERATFNESNLFKIYFFDNPPDRTWCDEELLSMKSSLADSPYTREQLIGFACSFADKENGCTKVWYFNPDTPFIVNGPLNLRNRDLSIWQGYEFDDAIRLYLSSGTLILPEMTCWAESQVVAHEQELMGHLGYNGYRKAQDLWTPSPLFSQRD